MIYDVWVETRDGKFAATHIVIDADSGVEALRHAAFELERTVPEEKQP